MFRVEQKNDWSLNQHPEVMNDNEKIHWYNEQWSMMIINFFDRQNYAHLMRNEQCCQSLK